MYDRATYIASRPGPTTGGGVSVTLAEEIPKAISSSFGSMLQQLASNQGQFGFHQGQEQPTPQGLRATVAPAVEA
eukprot:scaffold135986_cov34-Prasinocladus_malaysianus.AAC.1